MQELINHTPLKRHEIADMTPEQLAKMEIFYGAAIQGNRDRGERQHIHIAFIEAIKKAGFTVASEHTTGSSFEETSELLTHSLGKLPPVGKDRTIFIRNRMIELIEGDIKGAVFEVSVPSIGTGIEIAHAYLRSRLGLPEIPILALYEKGYWPNNLSSMVSGLPKEQFPNFQIMEFSSTSDGKNVIEDFLTGLRG